ncbi:MAG: TIGR02186 family protein [Cypionkella sp.]|nr:TIGR02186 family protein [Cypionkella sp.]
MRWLALALLLSQPVMATESLVTGLSRDDVQITADFTGTDILVYGAVRRDSPAPEDLPMDVIVTLEGPSSPLVVRRKERQFGIWINGAATEFGDVPSYFAIASTGPLADILTENDDLRHKISFERRISVTRLAAGSIDSHAFSSALQRIRGKQGSLQFDERGVKLAQDTLFRADFSLPSNLTEGRYRVRLFLLRGGQVMDTQDQSIDVRKTGIERQLTNMARNQPLLYGILSLLMAAAAGWAASELFRFIRR